MPKKAMRLDVGEEMGMDTAWRDYRINNMELPGSYISSERPLELRLILPAPTRAPPRPQFKASTALKGLLCVGRWSACAAA